MKNVLKYLSAALLLIVIGSSCKDNDNWVILDDVQPGSYITGDATIYSAAASASAFTRAALDGSDDVNDVLSIYTWLKAGSGFNILKVDNEGNQVSYGKGASVASDYDTVDLVADGTPFTVSKDGLYLVVLNNADNQATVVEADFGIIGDATPGSWSSETKFASTVFDEKYSTVEMTLSGVTLNNKELKFRYAQTWGMAIPYKGATVTIHSNMGNSGSSTAAMTTAFSECKGGGGNFSLSDAGIYEVTLKLELRSGKFTGKAVCTAKDESSAKLPEKMYIIGAPFDWSWDKAEELIPVHSHDGNFWAIYYFNEGDGIKFNSALDWNGDQFGAENEDPRGYGEYAAGGENLVIATTGYYLVWIQCSLSADKKSVVSKVVLSEPNPYVIGECAANGWSDQLAAADKFALDGDVYKSAVLNAGELRMCVKLDNVDWWQTEFMIFDGKIVYRGAAGDQDRVQATAGQIVTLDFKDNTGSIQ